MSLGRTRFSDKFERRRHVCAHPARSMLRKSDRSRVRGRTNDAGDDLPNTLLPDGRRGKTRYMQRQAGKSLARVMMWMTNHRASVMPRVR